MPVNKPSLDKKDLRGLRPLIIVAKKQEKTVALDHSEIYKLDNKKISFKAPNNISICLSISEREYDVAKDMFIRLVRPKLKSPKDNIEFETTEINDLYDYFEHLQISLIFIYTAVEAFANIAIPREFTYEKLNNKKVKEIWNKESIERWLPTSEKISNIIPSILKLKSPKTEPFWADFTKLEEIRNEIIHQKTVTNENNVSSKYLKEFFDENVFKVIRAGFSVIEYFCSNSEHGHIYFPKGIGKLMVTPIEIDDFDEYFEEVTEDDK